MASDRVKIMKIPILTFVFLMSSSSFGTVYFYSKDLPVRKGVKVAITNYTSLMDGVFEGYAVNADGEGLFYTKGKYLVKSIKGLTARRTQRNPSSLIGKVFILSDKLETVMPPPVGKLKKTQ